jgi:hypothetical protein
MGNLPITKSFAVFLNQANPSFDTDAPLAVNHGLLIERSVRYNREPFEFFPARITEISSRQHEGQSHACEPVL